MGVYSWPFNETSSLTTDLLGGIGFFIYRKLCPIYLSRELNFGGSIFMLQVPYFL
jgi:hypothetical protein